MRFWNNLLPVVQQLVFLDKLQLKLFTGDFLNYFFEIDRAVRSRTEYI